MLLGSFVTSNVYIWSYSALLKLRAGTSFYLPHKLSVEHASESWRKCLMKVSFMLIFTQNSRIHGTKQAQDSLQRFAFTLSNNRIGWVLYSMTVDYIWLMYSICEFCPVNIQLPYKTQIFEPWPGRINQSFFKNQNKTTNKLQKNWTIRKTTNTPSAFLLQAPHPQTTPPIPQKNISCLFIIKRWFTNLTVPKEAGSW